MSSAVSMSCVRVQAPRKKDWTKPVKMMKFPNMTMKDTSTLSVGKGQQTIEWSMDSAFVVHPDFKSHV